MNLVFVYGTLKRGFCRSSYLDRQRFIGTAETVPEYKLYDLGNYPGMVHVGGLANSIKGELFEVDPKGLALLDMLEDVDQGLYRRSEVRLWFVNPDVLPLSQTALQALERKVALSYFFNGSVTEYEEIGTVWKKG